MTLITNNTYDDMQSMIELFMNDRSGDGNVMHNELGIDEQRRLKHTHNPDNAIDKVFRDTETPTGSSKLISEGLPMFFPLHPLPTQKKKHLVSCLDCSCKILLILKKASAYTMSFLKLHLSEDHNF